MSDEWQISELSILLWMSQKGDNCNLSGIYIHEKIVLSTICILHDWLYRIQTKSFSCTSSASVCNLNELTLHYCSLNPKLEESFLKILWNTVLNRKYLVICCAKLICMWWNTVFKYKYPIKIFIKPKASGDLVEYYVQTIKSVLYHE